MTGGGPTTPRCMVRSKREIPHYYLEHQVDVTACEQWLTQKNATRPPDDRLLIGALAIKAAALAARRFPAFNGFYRDGKFEPASAVHVGVAIAIRGGGLAAPALHEADRMPVEKLLCFTLSSAAEIAQLHKTAVGINYISNAHRQRMSVSVVAPPRFEPTNIVALSGRKLHAAL